MGAEFVRQLDKEASFWELNALVPSTRRSYQSQMNCYINFCTMINAVPVPASSSTILRYAAFLARSKALSTIKQYLQAVRYLHRGVACCLSSENWRLKSMLLGITRVKGANTTFKLPLTLAHLRDIQACLRGSAVLVNSCYRVFWTP